MSVTLASL
uniref:Uncharacterized protein n=1 Tax=Arundo donax TaxID=35708 RepID=A0A0A9BRA3_ARUDO